MIDKIFSIVMTIIIVLALSILLYTSVFSGQVATHQTARLNYEQEYGELLIQSLLLSHDNATDLSYESLLARSIEEIDTDILVNGRNVNVEDRFEEPLDRLLGDDNYYFSIAPLRKGVAVTYILDGSPTMRPKRDAVKQRMPLLIGNLTETFGAGAAIYTDVYILGDDPSLCAGFPGRCTLLQGDLLYDSLSGHGVLGPYPQPYHSFGEWRQSTHMARTTDFSSSDWASATAYASYAYQSDRQRRIATNKHVIVVVADEMTTGSKADACYGITSDLNDYLICMLCNATCPVDRSQRIINSTKEVLQQHGDLFIGFHDVACDFPYDTRYNTFYLTPYTCNYLDSRARCTGLADGTRTERPLSSNPPANANWCQQNSCGGCSQQGGAYCAHTNCGPHLIDDLQELAVATSGRSQPLTNLNDLTDAVSSYFSQQVGEYNLTLGVRNESRDRYVIEQPMVLADGTRLQLRFWIYD